MMDGPGLSYVLDGFDEADGEDAPWIGELEQQIQAGRRSKKGSKADEASSQAIVQSLCSWRSLTPHLVRSDGGATVAQMRSSKAFGEAARGAINSGTTAVPPRCGRCSSSSSQTRAGSTSRLGSEPRKTNGLTPCVDHTLSCLKAHAVLLGNHRSTCWGTKLCPD